jgi:hypothetical protein
MFTQPHSRIGRKILSTAALGILFFIAGVNTVFADEIAIWNFNDSDLVVDHGTGILTSNFVSANILFAAGTTNNARLGDPAGQALSLQGGTSNTNNGGTSHSM